MKNVPYKFRGVDVDSDQYVYAELGDIEYIGDNIYNFCSELYSLHNAYRESIVQLVGYDEEGNEIYEGDTVTDSEGHKYTATLESRVEWEGTDTVSEQWTLPFEQVEDLDANRTMSLELWKKFELKAKSWLKKEASEDEEHSN